MTGFEVSSFALSSQWGQVRGVQVEDVNIQGFVEKTYYDAEDGSKKKAKELATETQPNDAHMPTHTVLVLHRFRQHR